MEDEVWSYGMLTYSSSSSKYNPVANKSSSYDFYDDYEEVDCDDDLEPEYVCPFCNEDFDILGLCCHIEEAHPLESKKGLCPICRVDIGVSLIDHVVMEHEYIQRRGGHGGRESNTISMLQKELDDRSLETFLMRTPSLDSSTNVVVDRLLTSFIGNYPSTTGFQSTPSSSNELIQEENSLTENVLERAMENLSVSDENKEEKAQRCEYIQSLLLYTILDDCL